MEQGQEINLFGLKSMLETYCFFGTTAKRSNDKSILYVYKSFKYSSTTIRVLVKKLNSSMIPSPKVVAFVLINDEKFYTWNSFIAKLKIITKHVSKENKYSDNCRRPCPYSSKHDAKRIQMVRKYTQKK